jgi:hypothetical protein
MQKFEFWDWVSWALLCIGAATVCTVILEASSLLFGRKGDMP